MRSLHIAIATITLCMEAQGESRLGKLAVAYVLFNREKRGTSITDVILKPWQFSCWNTDSPTRMNLDTVSEAVWAECLSIVLIAMHNLESDPTHGAIFYLNKKTVMATNGKLPDWWEIDGDPSSEITIDAHSFRCHR